VDRDPEDEARIAAIVAGGRATRRSPSRATWIAAAVVGAICALGFVLLVAWGGEPDAAAPAAGGSAEPRRPASGGGCAGGLGLGLGLGLAIGFALGRWLGPRNGAQEASHDRSTPPVDRLTGADAGSAVRSRSPLADSGAQGAGADHSSRNRP
jgi:hypothetical protein